MKIIHVTIWHYLLPSSLSSENNDAAFQLPEEYMEELLEDEDEFEDE